MNKETTLNFPTGLGQGAGGHGRTGHGRTHFQDKLDLIFYKCLMRVAAQQEHWLSKYKDAQIKQGSSRREAWRQGPGMRAGRIAKINIMYYCVMLVCCSTTKPVIKLYGCTNQTSPDLPRAFGSRADGRGCTRTRPDAFPS
jgi:hypothetical protein